MSRRLLFLQNVERSMIRNGAVIAEDATTYNVYAVIDKKYKSATGKILYVEESQFKK